MEIRPSITERLDTRSTLKNGQHPVKIMVYYKREQKTFSPLKPISATKNDFAAYKSGGSKTSEVRKLRNDIQEQLAKAREAADSLKVFTFTAFKRAFESEKLAASTGGKETTLKALLDRKRNELKSAGQFNSEKAYGCAYSNLAGFAKKYLRLKEGNVALEHVTMDFLNDYKKWNVNEGNSFATVGSYLRHLKHIWNMAMDDELIHTSLYPFGPKKFVIGGNVARKKYLTEEQLQKFYFDKRYENHEAKHYFFFSYFCGMNPADVANLKMEDIYMPDPVSAYLRFYRQKTKDSGKETKPITIHLKPDMLHVISALRPENSKSKYVFPILSEDMTEEERYNAIINWKRLLNRKLNRIAKSLGFDDLNMSLARATFATTIFKKGIAVGKISALMGHSSQRTTELYLGSLTEFEVAETTDTLETFKKGKEGKVSINPKLLDKLNG